MGDAVHECVGVCHWKLQGVLRAKRFYSTAELVGLYKAHFLSYIEYRTPGIAHAAATVLAPTDAIQARFLREIGLSEEDAFLSFKLAPLHTRRDIAMFGLIHRASCAWTRVFTCPQIISSITLASAGQSWTSY